MTPAPAQRRLAQPAQGVAIGRICPVVAQQCALARSCVLFNDPKIGARNLDDQARAWNCPKRGAFVYRDERTTHTFHVNEHPDHARYAARLLQLNKLRSARRRRAQVSMWEMKPAEADAAAQHGG